MQTMNSKDRTFEGKATIENICSKVAEFDEVSWLNFTLLANAYKQGKYAGYELGKREAAMAASNGGEA